MDCRYKLLIALVVCCQTVLAQDFAKKIVGHWRGATGIDTVGRVVFDAKGYFTMMGGGFWLDGREFVHKGKRLSCTYILDESNKPVRMKIRLLDVENGNQELESH